MIKRVFAPLAAVLVLGLGACSRHDESAGGSGGGIEPGEWETTAELTRVDADNLPEDIRRTIRLPASRTTTSRGCWTVTAELVRVRNLRFTIPDPYLRGAGCNFAELTIEGGTLRGRMSCTGFPAPPGPSGGRTMAISGALDGSYSQTTLRATMHGEVRFGTNSGSADIRFSSRRIGECPPAPPRPAYVPPAGPVYGPDAPEMNRPVPVIQVPVPPPVSGKPAGPAR
jgi:hypothetical protein